MLVKSLLSIASATLALASPCAKSIPTLPYNGGGTELPSPPAGVTLKHIALGFGIQNYSCADAGSSATATGALAMLYDITNLYPGFRRNALSSDEWTELTATALNSGDVPLNLVSSGGADPANPFTEPKPLKVDGRSIPFLGHHFFNAAGTPVFDLGYQVLHGKKLNSVPAPASADPGPEGTGAVAWLYLGDAGGSIGLSYVYRVLTAGGNPKACSASGSESTSYAAQYWFYG